MRNINAGREKLLGLLLVVSIIPMIMYPVNTNAEVTNTRDAFLEEKMLKGVRVEVFKKIETFVKERMKKMNALKETVRRAEYVSPYTSHKMEDLEEEKSVNYYLLNTERNLRRRQRKSFASTNSEFTYIPHSDGSIIYFKNGLVSRIVNGRAVDGLGNVSIRNSYNYQYNDKRLLTSFESDTQDNLGNITHIRQYGMGYTVDSVFYADKDTNANKNLTEYFVEETDSAGNKKIVHFYGAEYAGKFLRSFSQTIEDSIYGNSSFTRSNITYADNNPEQTASYHEEGIGNDGLKYELNRTNITYNDKDQITGYHEEIIITQIDGSKTKTITDAKFKYLSVPHQFGPDVEEPDPDRLLESTITTQTINADGSEKTEKTIITYQYDTNQQLIGASGNSEFIGQEADWWQYSDNKGYTLSRNKDADDNVTYSYIDPDTLETVFVPEEEVTATLENGDLYQGTSNIQYEIMYGEPMAKEAKTTTQYYGKNIGDDELKREEVTIITHDNGLVNNLSRTLNTQENTVTTFSLLDPDNSHKEVRNVTTTYLYDDKGNLIDVQGNGIKAGWEYQSTRGFYGEYTSIITIKYEVILGKALPTDTLEEKIYEMGGVK